MAVGTGAGDGLVLGVLVGGPSAGFKFSESILFLFCIFGPFTLGFPPFQLPEPSVPLLLLRGLGLQIPTSPFLR